MDCILMILLLLGFGVAIPLHRNDPIDPIVFPVPAPPTTESPDSSEQNRHHRSVDVLDQRAVFPAPERGDRPKRQFPPRGDSHSRELNDDPVDLANRFRRHIPAEDGSYPSAIDFEELGISRRPGRESERRKREDGGFPAVFATGTENRPMRAVFPAPEPLERPKRDAAPQHWPPRYPGDWPKSNEWDDFDGRDKRDAGFEGNRPRRQLPPKDGGFPGVVDFGDQHRPARAVFPAPQHSERPKRSPNFEGGDRSSADFASDGQQRPIRAVFPAPQHSDRPKRSAETEIGHPAAGDQHRPIRAVFPAPEPSDRQKRNADAEISNHPAGGDQHRPIRAVFPAPEPSDRQKRKTPPNGAKNPKTHNDGYPPMDLTNRPPRQISSFPSQLDSFGPADQHRPARAASEPPNRQKRDARTDGDGHWEVYHSKKPSQSPMAGFPTPQQLDRPKREIPKQSDSQKAASSPFKGFPPIRRQPDAATDPDVALVMNGRKRRSEEMAGRPKRSAGDFFGYDNANGMAGKPKRSAEELERQKRSISERSERSDGHRRPQRSLPELLDDHQPSGTLPASPNGQQWPTLSSEIPPTEPDVQPIRSELRLTAAARNPQPAETPKPKPDRIPQPNSEVYPLPTSPDGRRQFPVGDHPTATEDHFPESGGHPLREPNDDLEAKISNVADFRPLPQPGDSAERTEGSAERTHDSAEGIATLPMNEFAKSTESPPIPTELPPRIGPPPLKSDESAELGSKSAERRPRISPLPIQPQPMHQFDSASHSGSPKSTEPALPKSPESKNRRKRETAQFPDSMESREPLELRDFHPADQKPIAGPMRPFYPNPSDPHRTNPHSIVDPPPNDPSGPLDGGEGLHQFPWGQKPKSDDERKRDSQMDSAKRRDDPYEPKNGFGSIFGQNPHFEGKRAAPYGRQADQRDPWDPRRPMDEHKPSAASRRYPAERRNRPAEMEKPLEPLEVRMAEGYSFGDEFDPFDDPYDVAPVPLWPLAPLNDEMKVRKPLRDQRIPSRPLSDPQKPLSEPTRREDPLEHRENAGNRLNSPTLTSELHIPSNPQNPHHPEPHLDDAPHRPRDPLHPRGQDGRPNPWDPLGRRPVPPPLLGNLLIRLLAFPHGDRDPQKQSPDEPDARTQRSLAESSKGGRRLSDNGRRPAEPKENPKEPIPNWTHSNERSDRFHFPTNPNPFEGRITTDFLPSPPYESNPTNPLGGQPNGFSGNGWDGLNGNQPNALYPTQQNGFNGNQPNGLYPNPSNQPNGNQPNSLYPNQPNGLNGNQPNGLYPNQPNGNQPNIRPPFGTQPTAFQPNPPNSNGFGQNNGLYPNANPQYPNGPIGFDWTTGSMP